MLHNFKRFTTLTSHPTRICLKSQDDVTNREQIQLGKSTGNEGNFVIFLDPKSVCIKWM